MKGYGGATELRGALRLDVVHGDFGSPAMDKLGLLEMARLGLPQRGLSAEVNDWRTRNVRNLWRSARGVRRALACPFPVMVGALYLAHLSPRFGRRELGLAGTRIVTTAYVELLVDRLIAAGNINAHNFHGIGTGSTAEGVGETALVTEITTEYATDNVRPSGTQVEASSVIYRTVGTVTVDAQVLTREHGIFDQAATGGGILMDRTTFALITLENGDSLQATYELTVTAGG